MEASYHIPVLLSACLDALVTNPDGVYVDATFGGGGHTKGILSRLSATGKVIAFDQDQDVHGHAQALMQEDARFQFVPVNFEFIPNYLSALGYPVVDGITADLGVSSHQFDEAARGFSIRYDAPLDMRMNQNQAYTAVHVLNELSEADLHKAFGLYGELKNAKSLARTIVAARLQEPITRTLQLVELCRPMAPHKKEHQFFAKIFQAIRILVNQELDVLKTFLTHTTSMIKPGGRLVVITYHSLEDRLTKHFIQKGKFAGEVEKDFFGNSLAPFVPVSTKAILPSEREQNENPRSRSAKMRVGEKRLIEPANV